MNIKISQISSSEKIFNGIGDAKEICRQTLLRGESFSYQLFFEADKEIFPESGKDFPLLKIEVISPLRDYIKLYSAKNIPCDFPVYSTEDTDYITKAPCLVPDMLSPIENGILKLIGKTETVWVQIKLPKDIGGSEYPLTVRFTHNHKETEKTVILDVLEAKLPEQKTLFTQWFHVDCIADIHNVPIYSEEHWILIDKYMELYSELGMNMILTPCITPPIDTQIGGRRPCTQLVSIEKNGGEYSFNFSLLERWLGLCQKHKIEYFEISHLFSQWGLKSAPNIKASENGREKYIFGWDVPADSEEYKAFLGQFLPALVGFLEARGIKDKCYFHISDEPSLKHLDAYKYAHSIVKPLIKDCKTMDAISDFDFYEKGLIETPVTATDCIEPFLENGNENQWAYYCCCQFDKVGNRFLAMPSYRNRILGIQMYKYGIKGFLHWGYNFYYSQLSVKLINPYITSSADKAFPSGDPFSVYPVRGGAVPSLRALVFKEALEDIELCRKLEEFIGKDGVIQLIEAEAKMSITFKDYPRNSEFIPSVMDKIREKIREYI